MAQFKPGDRVRRTGDSYSEYDVFRGEVYTVDYIDNGYIKLIDRRGTWEPHNFTLVESPPTMTSLPSKFSLLFKKEPEKTLIKAGIMGDDEMLTADGQKIFLAFLLKKNGDDFVKEVVRPLLDEGKED